jgi:hypothetical protein
MRQYVLVDFSSDEEGADTFNVYMSWRDLNNLLSLVKRESRLDPSTCSLIHHYIGSTKFADYASYYGLNISRVFFNIVPLFVNAGATLVPLIQSNLRGVSTESKFFASHFSSVHLADTEHPSVTCGPIALL